MTASHLALDDFSWNLHTNVSLFKSCPWDPLSHPIFPWRAFELLVATSFLLTDGSRGSTRNMGNAFLFHLFPPQQCGSLQWGTLGGATTTPKNLLHPKNTGCSHLSTSAQRTQPGSQKNTEPKCSHCRWNTWWKTPAKLQNFMTWETVGFFSKRQLTYSTLLLNLCPDQCPYWWASGPCTKAHNDWNYW